jgi:hypothetical protein
MFTHRRLIDKPVQDKIILNLTQSYELGRLPSAQGHQDLMDTVHLVLELFPCPAPYPTRKEFLISGQTVVERIKQVFHIVEDKTQPVPAFLAGKQQGEKEPDNEKDSHRPFILDDETTGISAVKPGEIILR